MSSLPQKLWDNWDMSNILKAEQIGNKCRSEKDCAKRVEEKFQQMYVTGKKLFASLNNPPPPNIWEFLYSQASEAFYCWSLCFSAWVLSHDITDKCCNERFAWGWPCPSEPGRCSSGTKEKRIRWTVTQRSCYICSWLWSIESVAIETSKEALKSQGTCYPRSGNFWLGCGPRDVTASCPCYSCWSFSLWSST